MKSFTIKSVDDLKRAWPMMRELIITMIQASPVIVRIEAESKRRAQEKKYSAMINDISKTGVIELNGVETRVSSPEAMKALLVYWFELELKSMGESLRHAGSTIICPRTAEVIQIRASTKKFTIKEGSAFIEFLYAKGAEMGAIWSEQVKGFEEYPEFNG
jgi:hypothetical protein